MGAEIKKKTVEKFTLKRRECMDLTVPGDKLLSDSSNRFGNWEAKNYHKLLWNNLQLGKKGKSLQSTARVDLILWTSEWKGFREVG